MRLRNGHLTLGYPISGRRKKVLGGPGAGPGGPTAVAECRKPTNCSRATSIGVRREAGFFDIDEWEKDPCPKR
jgi:hypothetical protein